jgi:hypothetical protein
MNKKIRNADKLLKTIENKEILRNKEYESLLYINEKLKNMDFSANSNKKMCILKL